MTSADWTKPQEDIAACTYKKNDRVHRLLAIKMRRWERNNKVTVVPIGVSKDHQPITGEQQLKRAQEQRAEYNRVKKSESLGGKAAAEAKRLANKLKPLHKKGELDHGFDNSVIRNKNKAKSGYQNLKLNKDGTYSVKVGGMMPGSYPLEEAIKVRDRQREIAGLCPAEY